MGEDPLTDHGLPFRYGPMAGLPDAVDVSSGVEIKPGRKDIGKVEAFCQSVMACRSGIGRSIFK